MFNLIYAFDLQIFAQAGDAINGTAGVVNAYTGKVTTSSAMDPTMKEFYDTELLDNYREKAIYAQFGKTQHLPAHHGTTVEWRKWNTFKRAGALQEGVIPQAQAFGMTKLNGAIGQFGTYTAVTDILEMRGYDDVIAGASTEMGASAAETEEDLIRKALLTGTNVMYCDNVVKETGEFKSTPTSPATMGASATDGWAILTPDMVAKARTHMVKNKVPTIGGRYVMVVHPSCVYDLRKSDEWIEAHKYAATSEIFNGEIGELHGVRFVENTFAPVLTGEYKNKAGGVTYANFLFGKDAFGIIDPEGGNLEMIVKDKSQVGGPLNQFSTIGYKFEHNGATILYQERMLRLMSVSSSSATDEQNLTEE